MTEGTGTGMMLGGMVVMMQMMSAHETLMEAMRFAPRHVRALGDTLGLTSEQIGSLDQLMDQHEAACHEMMQGMQSTERTLSDLLDGEVLDTAALRSAALETFRAHAELHAQMLVDAATVRSILTAEQRARVLMLPMPSMTMGEHMNDTSRMPAAGHRR